MIHRNESFQEMCKELKDRKIVCWGVGNYFNAFWDSISGFVEEENIQFLVDNSLDKQKQGICIGKRQKDIVSSEHFLEHWKDEILIITTVHYNAILLQIQEYLEGKECYIYPLIRHVGDWDNLKIKRCEEALIPKIIHYCWFGANEMPREESEYIAGWKKICPDYEFVCWNEKNFDVMSTAYTKWVFENKKWAHLSDYVRMHALYEYGGFYFDTDVELVKEIEELRYQKGFWSMEETGCANSGSGIGMVSHNELIGKLLEEYRSISYEDLEEGKKLSVNADRESSLLRQYGFKANNCYQIINDIAIYPSEFFSPKLIGTSDVYITPNTYAVHHYKLSWL